MCEVTRFDDWFNRHRRATLGRSPSALAIRPYTTPPSILQKKIMALRPQRARPSVAGTHIKPPSICVDQHAWMLWAHTNKLLLQCSFCRFVRHRGNHFSRHVKRKTIRSETATAAYKHKHARYASFVQLKLLKPIGTVLPQAVVLSLDQFTRHTQEGTQSSDHPPMKLHVWTRDRRAARAN